MVSLRHRSIIGGIILGVIVIGAVTTSPGTLLELAETATQHPIHFGLLISLLYLVRPVFAWPTTPLAIVVGYGYGIGLGIPVALIGVLVTITPVYFVARWLTNGTNRTDSTTETITSQENVTTDGPDESQRTTLIDIYCRSIRWTEDAITRYFDETGPIRGIVVSRLVPIPSDVSTSAAAASGVRYKHVVIGTAIGELPWTVAAVIVGASASTVATRGLSELGFALAIACILAAAFLLAGPLYRLSRDSSLESNVG